MLKKLFFLLLILLTIIDVIYASFPVLPIEQIEITVENNTYKKIDEKNYCLVVFK